MQTRKLQKGKKKNKKTQVRCYIKATHHSSAAVRSIAGEWSDIPDLRRPAMM